MTLGYRVSFASTPSGPYTFYDMTIDKLATGLTVDGLQPGSTKFFIVETQTDPHANNQNTVVSDPSRVVRARGLLNPIPVLQPIGIGLLISALLVVGLLVLRSHAPV